jgi:sigma-E factor negative regulatory protein RseC
MAGMNKSRVDMPMLEATGKVMAVDGEYVVVETRQRSACGHCSAGERCDVSVLSGLFSARRNQVRLSNHLNLSAGDIVVMGINESVLLTTAMMAYMLPLVMMIAFATVINLQGFEDAISFMAGLVGLFTGMQLSNFLMARRHTPYREIVLLRKANESVVRYTKTHTV